MSTNREQMIQEMIKNIQENGYNAEHLTEVAIPGAYTPVKSSDMKSDIDH